MNLNRHWLDMYIKKSRDMRYYMINGNTAKNEYLSVSQFFSSYALGLTESESYRVF